MSQYDGSRGRLSAPAALRHRAARPSALSPFGSSQSGIDWRGALRNVLGWTVTAIALALWLFVIPAFFGGM